MQQTCGAVEWHSVTTLGASIAAVQCKCMVVGCTMTYVSVNCKTFGQCVQSCYGCSRIEEHNGQATHQLPALNGCNFTAEQQQRASPAGRSFLYYVQTVRLL